MWRVAMIPVLALAGLVGCGDDDDEAHGDPDRYCELSREMDQAGDEAFAELEEDEDATEQDFARAERAFLEAHSDEFDEIREVAPDEIRADVDTLLDAVRARAQGSEESSPEADEAEQHVTEFEDQNCS
jgi:hypothetical protein